MPIDTLNNKLDLWNEATKRRTNLVWFHFRLSYLKTGIISNVMCRLFYTGLFHLSDHKRVNCFRDWLRVPFSRKLPVNEWQASNLSPVWYVRNCFRHYHVRLIVCRVCELAAPRKSPFSKKRLWDCVNLVWKLHTD